LGYMVQDCSAAVENLMLSALGLGIGSVWLGVYPQSDRIKRLGELLELSPNRVPLAVISLGYPAESQPSRTRYREQNVTWIE
jgi:nitroreductase